MELALCQGSTVWRDGEKGKETPVVGIARPRAARRWASTLAGLLVPTGKATVGWSKAVTSEGPGSIPRGTHSHRGLLGKVEALGSEEDQPGSCVQ